MLDRCKPLTRRDARCRTDRAVLAVNGFAADGNMFVKKVKQRLEVRRLRSPRVAPRSHRPLHAFQWYRHAHAKDMPLRAIARLIQTMLYAQRFFPYYVYNILGGIEEDGESALFLPAPAARPRVPRAPPGFSSRTRTQNPSHVMPLD